MKTLEHSKSLAYAGWLFSLMHDFQSHDIPIGGMYVLIAENIYLAQVRFQFLISESTFMRCVCR